MFNKLGIQLLKDLSYPQQIFILKFSIDLESFMTSYLSNDYLVDLILMLRQTLVFTMRQICGSFQQHTLNVYGVVTALIQYYQHSGLPIHWVNYYTRLRPIYGYIGAANQALYGEHSSA